MTEQTYLYFFKLDALDAMLDLFAGAVLKQLSLPPSADGGFLLPLDAGKNREAMDWLPALESNES